MITVGWLHDHRYQDRPGGAQLNSDAMAEATPEGVQAVRCYPGQGVPDCDYYVLHNVKWFSMAELKVATSRPWVKVAHDYWDIHQNWQRDWIAPIMNGAEAVVFLSPLHREAYLRSHPEVMPRRTFLVPSPVDPDLFTVQSSDGRWGTCWLGEFQPHKGVVAACEWAREHGLVDFYGWGPVVPSGKNVRVIGMLPYQDVPRALAQYRRFLFLPEWYEPFGRTVAEARLAGCELVVNQRIGATSWGWETREEWARGVGQAAKRLWDVLGMMFGL